MSEPIRGCSCPHSTIHPRPRRCPGTWNSYSSCPLTCLLTAHLLLDWEVQWRSWRRQERLTGSGKGGSQTDTGEGFRAQKAPELIWYEAHLRAFQPVAAAVEAAERDPCLPNTGVTNDGLLPG